MSEIKKIRKIFLQWKAPVRHLWFLIYALVVVEISSAAVILCLLFYSKLYNPDLRDKVVFYKSDIPHPVFHSADKPLPVSSHPNFLYYPINQRFGGSRLWLKDPLSLSQTVNVVLLGGSTVEGDGASSEQTTIAKRLEFFLNEERPVGCAPVRVLNEGISGFTRKQQFLLLTTGLLPKIGSQIDTVVNFDGVNDFLAFVSDRRSVASPFHDLMSTRELEVTSLLDEFLSTGKVAYRNPPLRKRYAGRLWQSFQNLSNGSHQQTDDFGHTADLGVVTLNVDSRVASYLYYGRITSEILEANKISYVEVLQPYIRYKKNKSPVERINRIASSKYPRKFWELFDRYYEKLDKNFSGRVDRINMSNLFLRFDKEAFTDHVHYTDDGQDLIGEALAEKIKGIVPCRKDYR